MNTHLDCGCIPGPVGTGRNHGNLRVLCALSIGTIEGRSLPSKLQVSLTLLAELWRFATRQLIEMRRLLQAQAHAQQEIETGYRSISGFGEVAARTFAIALGDMTRFANERAMFIGTLYIGWCAKMCGICDDGLRCRIYTS